MHERTAGRRRVADDGLRRGWPSVHQRSKWLGSLIVRTLRRSLVLVHGSIVPNNAPYGTPVQGPATGTVVLAGAVNAVVSWGDPATPAAAPRKLTREAG